MLHIKMYGTGTSGYQLARAKLKEYLRRASIIYQLQEVTDVNSFIHDMVVSVPAIRVNDGVIYELKQNDQYNVSLRDIIQSIIKNENYGSLTKIVVPTDFSETSFNAYNFANHLAKSIDGVILLTHIFNSQKADLEPLSTEVAKTKLNKYIQSVNQDWIGSFVTEPLVEGVFLQGNVIDELKELSKKGNTMIVMGMSGNTKNSHKIFSDLILEFVHKSHCPLFIIPSEYAYVFPTEIVLLSQDLSGSATHILYVGKLSQILNATFKIICLNDGKDEQKGMSDLIQLMDSTLSTLKYAVEYIHITESSNAIESLMGRRNNIIVMSPQDKIIFQSIFQRKVADKAHGKMQAPLLVLNDGCSKPNL
jgi:nucleotide-binding universal stress UspA family protein